MRSPDSLLLVEETTWTCPVRTGKVCRYIIPGTPSRWLRRLISDATFQDKSLAWALAPTVLHLPYYILLSRQHLSPSVWSRFYKITFLASANGYSYVPPVVLVLFFLRFLTFARILSKKQLFRKSKKSCCWKVCACLLKDIRMDYRIKVYVCLYVRWKIYACLLKDTRIDSRSILFFVLCVYFYNKQGGGGRGDKRGVSKGRGGTHGARRLGAPRVRAQHSREVRTW